MTVELDPDDVRIAVETLLGREVDDLTWRAQPIDPQLRLHSITEAVVRVSGGADGTAWSLVVKAMRLGHDDDPDALWVSGAEPTHRNYWKREWLAYSTGLLADLPGRLRAPRCLLATEPGPDRAWVWLEAVAGRPGRHWAASDYAAAARDLGTTQGALAPGPLPDAEWLAHRWLRGWVDACGRYVDLLGDPTAWHDDRLAPLRPLLGRVQALWAAREDLLAVTEGAPATLGHNDLWPTNLIAGDDGRTVAVDWSQVGVAALGQDLDQLALDPVWMQVLPDHDLDELEASVVPAYVEGLRAGGLDVADAEVARWYTAAASLHYACFAGSQADLVRDAAVVASRERRFGRPFGELVADRARVVERAVTLGERVLERR